jgi:translation initiation factor 3 subunit I
MKPIMITGHTRPLTQIKYNREGDLLFTAAKDKVPSVWYSHDGQRLGTFDGHNGAVLCCAVDSTSRFFFSGSADNTVRVWDVQTGKTLSTLSTPTGVRTLQLSYDETKLMYATDNTMGQQCTLNIIDIKQLLQEGESAAPSWSVTTTDKVTCGLYGLCDESIIVGTDTGELRQFDVATKEMMRKLQAHKKYINDLQYNKDMSMFITASKDQSARLFDTLSFEEMRAFETTRPINSAAISPLKDHVVIGGGQEARDVTTTHNKQGKFDAQFFHMIFGELMGSVKGHFGPINTLAFHPRGIGYASGGEDGYIRVHEFDESYFSFRFEH